MKIKLLLCNKYDFLTSCIMDYISILEFQDLMDSMKPGTPPQRATH
jgi:hypothetical protein